MCNGHLYRQITLAPNVFQIREVAWPPRSLFVLDQIVEGNEINRLAVHGAFYAILPCLRKANSGNAGQDVDTHRVDADLIYQARLAESICGDAIVIERCTELSESIKETNGVVQARSTS